MRQTIKDLLQSMEIQISEKVDDPVRGFRIIREIERNKFRLRNILSSEKVKLDDIPLLPSNSAYDHELILKKYAHYTSVLYANIEHGLYFGDNISNNMIPFKREFEIGAFITYGEYRKRLLEKAYPEHLVVPVGPYIIYAEPAPSFVDTIRNTIEHSEGTLLYFLRHSTSNVRVNHDLGSVCAKIKHIAMRADCKNAVVCLHPLDNSALVRDFFAQQGMVALCAATDKKFLMNLRALIEMADVTASDSIGTHIGYCLSLGRPHLVFDPEFDFTKVEPGIDAEVLKQQHDQIGRLFDGRKHLDVTKDQIACCDYYWGLSDPIAPQSLSQIFSEIEKHYKLQAYR